MILIGYDGSDDARAAITAAAQLMPGSAATVLTVWEPFGAILFRTPGGPGPCAGLGDIEDIDHAAQKAAAARAAEGAELARRAGMDATPTDFLARRDDRRHDSRCGRPGRRRRDHARLPRPPPNSVDAARERLPRSRPARGPNGDRHPLPPCRRDTAPTDRIAARPQAAPPEPGVRLATQQPGDAVARSGGNMTSGVAAAFCRSPLSSGRAGPASQQQHRTG
jgi:hypothetical protein